ncbi:MAG TPA: hypothetical protein VJU78_07950 [Chitinophagaceae bacterium]|nr:hypothetical protein [Chitinophagaceae bacterium]
MLENQTFRSAGVIIDYRFKPVSAKSFSSLTFAAAKARTAIGAIHVNFCS